MNEIRQAAFECLLLTDPIEKVTQTQQLYHQFNESGMTISSDKMDLPDQPGRPEKPELVAPKALPRRRNSVKDGHAPLIHSICHIEFNAINLGLDAVARFEALPDDYYYDWMQVAFEESQHFVLLRNHLLTLGYDYGAFPAHNGMWEMALKTHHDPLTRMALVPRVLEARGLDVTPKMMQKLKESGDDRIVDILQIILEEEIGHVKIGTRWFNYLCEQRQLDPFVTFKDLLNNYFAGELRGPFNNEARRMADFTDEEIALLNGE